MHRKFCSKMIEIEGGATELGPHLAIESMTLFARFRHLQRIKCLYLLTKGR